MSIGHQGRLPSSAPGSWLGSVLDGLPARVRFSGGTEAAGGEPRRLLFEDLDGTGFLAPVAPFANLGASRPLLGFCAFCPVGRTTGPGALLAAFLGCLVFVLGCPPPTVE